MSDTKLCEPLLVIKRARCFYGPFYTIVKILQFYIAVILIMLDKPYAPIVGWIMLIGFFYAEIIPNCFKFIACYDDCKSTNRLNFKLAPYMISSFLS